MLGIPSGLLQREKQLPSLHPSTVAGRCSRGFWSSVSLINILQRLASDLAAILGPDVLDENLLRFRVVTKMQTRSEGNHEENQKGQEPCASRAFLILRDLYALGGPIVFGQGRRKRRSRSWHQIRHLCAL